MKYGVHHAVVSDALYSLKFVEFASKDIEHKYHANASYQTRQAQMALSMLDHFSSQNKA